MADDRSHKDYPRGTILWHNAVPDRAPRKLLPSRGSRILLRYVHWIFVMLWLFLVWESFRNGSSFDFDWSFHFSMLLGLAAGWFLYTRFVFSRPRGYSIPGHLTPDTLFITSPEPGSVAIKDIKTVAPTYQEGSAGLLLALPDRTVKLVTSERDALLRALLSLRPDLAASLS